MGGDGVLKPTKYHSIHEIPDELVQQWSKRDPDNKLYQTRRWVNFKKKQILYAQQDGIPGYMRTPALRCMYYGTFITAFGMLFFNIYMFNQYQKKK